MYVSALGEVFAFKPTISPEYLVIFGVVAVILVLLRIYSKYRERESFHEKAKPKKDKKITIDRTPELIQRMRLNIGPDKKELKQIGLFFAFTDAQNQYIKNLCTAKKIHHPGQIFSDYAKIDEFLGEELHAAQSLKTSTKESEIEKTTLFLIRETIENKKKTGKRISSSRMIPEKQMLSLTLNEGEQHHVELVHNTATGLICTVPLNHDGTSVRIPLWTKTAVFFTVKNDQSYQFSSRIIKYDADIQSIRMVLAHTDAITSMPDRAHNRKSISVHCTFTPVTAGNVVNGKKTERRFYPTKNIFEGTLLDISAGGCSLESKTVLKPGEYVEIRCILEKQTEDTMIGKVVRVNDSSAGSVPAMHIQFAKIPRITMNRIFAYIYTDGERKK